MQKLIIVLLFISITFSESLFSQKELPNDFWEEISPKINWNVKNTAVYRRDVSKHGFDIEAKGLRSFYALSNGSMIFEKSRSSYFVSNDLGKTWQPIQFSDSYGKAIDLNLSTSKIYYTNDFYVLIDVNGLKYFNNFSEISQNRIYLSKDGKTWEKAYNSFELKKHIGVIFHKGELLKIRNYESVAHLKDYKNTMMIYHLDDNTVTIDPKTPIYELDLATDIYTRTDKNVSSFGKLEAIYNPCKGSYYHFRNPRYAPLASTDLVTFKPYEQDYSDRLRTPRFILCRNHMGHNIRVGSVEEQFIFKKFDEYEWINTGAKMNKVIYNSLDKSLYGVSFDSYGGARLFKSKIPIDCKCDEEN